jgi:hypothetical protein
VVSPVIVASARNSCKSSAAVAEAEEEGCS